MACLTLPDDLNERLIFLAAKAHMSREDYGLQALVEILENRENYLTTLERGKEDALSSVKKS